MMDRRTFLTVFAFSPLALSFAANNAVASTTKKTRSHFSVILVWLEGGASPWDSFMPLPKEVPVEFRGKYDAIDTAIAGVKVSSLFPKVAKVLHKASLVRSLNSGSGDHFISADRMLLDKGAKTLAQTIGTRLSTGGPGYSYINMPGLYSADPATVRCHQPNAAMKFMWDPGKKTIPPPHASRDPKRIAALRQRKSLLDSFDTAEIEHPLAHAIDKTREGAFDLLLGGGKYFDAFNIPKKDLTAFGDTDPASPNPLAHAAALARRMVKAGAGFVTIHHCEKQGWDMHANLYTDMPVLSGHLDDALAPLIEHAEDDGYVVVCTSEFGRTFKINGASKGGRDHEELHFMIGAGGKFKKGEAYGSYTTKGKLINPVANTAVWPTISEAAGISVPQNLSRISEILSTR